MKKTLRVAGIIIGVLILLLYIGLPVVMAVSVVYPSRQTVGAAPDGFHQVLLETSDGVTLQAWYKAPKNGAAVILLHGAGGSRESVRPYIPMLITNGYGVLAVDLRGHGGSGGRTNRLGWQGSRDVGAAVDFLQKQEEVNQIGGLGISMGGEVLVGAAGEYPALHAVAADGATRRCLEELLALPSERPLVRNFTARVMYTMVELFSGEQPPEPLPESLLAANNTRLLWIAAGDNDLEVAFNQMFAQSIIGRGELWIVPGVEHIGALQAYPGEYESRVIDFFDNTLKE
jgi:pimeloyl-ACP methyl ester carboxylesterase